MFVHTPRVIMATSYHAVGGRQPTPPSLFSGVNRARVCDFSVFGGEFHVPVALADRRSAERKFYSRMALFLVAVVFIGFAPSFYLRDIVPSYPRPNPTMPPSVLLHGGLFTLWMLVFVAQTQLVSAGRLQLHMKLGKASMFLAVAMIPMMYLAGVWQVARANQPPFIDALNWTAVPLAAIPAYALLVWTGWQRRKQAQWHKRAMLGAAILVVMGPGVGRLPIAPPTLGRLHHPDHRRAHAVRACGRDR